MDEARCKLCLSSSSSVNDQVLCFSTILSSVSDDHGLPVKCTVADILIKHFWFEVCVQQLLI